MMKTIAIISQKGGAGKTTLAVHLATAAHLAGITAAIFDLDPQASAEAWGQWRDDKPPEVVPAKAATLTRSLDRARAAGVGLVILDTPGAAEGAAGAAAEAADLILIPCRQSGADLHAIQQSVRLARMAGKPAAVVFNAIPPQSRDVKADAREIAQEITSKAAIPICPVHIAQRAAIAAAYDEGSTVLERDPQSRAAQEITALWQWTYQQLTQEAAA